MLGMKKHPFPSLPSPRGSPKAGNGVRGCAATAGYVGKRKAHSSAGGLISKYNKLPPDNGVGTGLGCSLSRSPGTAAALRRNRSGVRGSAPVRACPQT